MLRNRFIPILTFNESGLIKTRNFKEIKYIGDPLNTIKIFNEKKVDELALIDLDASKKDNIPNFKLIERVSKECRSPISYGGGIKNLDQIEKVISSGIEKVIISKAFFETKGIICSKAAKVFGSQSLVICFDIRQGKIIKNNYSTYTIRGTYNEKTSIIEAIKIAEDNGAGEIIINSIDRDGNRTGYDYNLLSHIYDITNIPIIMSGGAASFEEAKKLMGDFPGVSAAGSSVFILKGKFDAVLVQYPSEFER